MPAKTTSSLLRYGFLAALFLSALSGFAQMPIFKRYYIADIPGLAWLAYFYTTFKLHYLSAAVVMAIGAYLVTTYLLTHRPSVRIGMWGYLRGGLLLLILATGLLLVYRNFPGYRFDPLVIVALNFSHLGLVVVFLLVSLAATIFKRPWLRVQRYF